jgi:hypothetical protein
LKRKLLLLNLLLLALIGLVSWRLYIRYEETLRRQKAFLSAPSPAAPPPLVVLPPPQSQISAAAYLDIAAKLPFSKDRNPTVIVEAVAEKPMPALPRYYGMINFGSGPRVILATTPGGQQKGYVAGDKVGEFTIKEIAAAGLTFEWEGKVVTASYAKLTDNTAPVETQQAAMPVQAAKGAPTVAAVSSLSTDTAKPGIDIGGNLRGCTPGDKSPAGTVRDGYRKVVTVTPFGQSCSWEKVN